MRRRDFIGWLGGAAVSAPIAGRAQPAPRDGASSAAPGSAVADIPAKSISTQGSIAAGSNQLKLASAAGFSVGDSIIVEVGAESGRGRKGSIGVGGSWPRTLFQTYAELKASPPPKKGDHAGVLTGAETGLVYQSSGTEWWPWDKNLAYTNKIVPLALVARIVEIAGDTAMLDKSAAAGATGANVYYDNRPLLRFLGVAPTSASGRPEIVQLPPGVLYMGGGIAIHQRPGLTFRGAGRDATTIKFPKGVPLEGIVAFQCDDITLEDYKIHGNHAEHGFALDYAGQADSIGGGYGQANMLTLCRRAKVRRLAVQDVTQFAVGYRRSENCHTFDVHNIRTEPEQRYIQWLFNDSDSRGMLWEDVTTDNAFLCASFESFRSIDCVWRRCGGVNASWSLNSSTGFLLEECWQRIKPMAWNKSVVSPFHRLNPLLNINSNIANSSSKGAPGTGGTVRDFLSIQEGPQDENGHVFKAIVVNRGNSDVLIEGTSFEKAFVRAPYAPPTGPSADMYGPIINSTGDRTMVRGVRIQGFDPGHGGKLKQWAPPISVRDGVIENCVADKVSAPTIRGVRTNAELMR